MKYFILWRDQKGIYFEIIVPPAMGLVKELCGAAFFYSGENVLHPGIKLCRVEQCILFYIYMKLLFLFVA